MLNRIFRSRRSKAKLFSYIDCLLPKQKGKTLFVVKDRTYFSGNLRVTLEAYLEKSSKGLYVYKDGPLSDKLKAELQGLGVTVLHRFTLHTIWHIATSGTVILSHNPRDAHITRKCKKRYIINLWHGVAIKQIELLMPNIEEEKLRLLKNNSRLYDMVIASSQQDKETNAKAFGVALEQVKVTGLPRYEILKPTYRLGSVLAEEERKILQIKGNRKLVLYAPTFRENKPSAITQITDKEWDRLEKFAETNNIVFGIRPHPYDIKALPERIKNARSFHLFENTFYTEPNLLLRCTDILIVDFSSIWIDFLLLHRPIIGFSKDYKHYLEEERGFIYDFHAIFPTEFTVDVQTLIAKIEEAIEFDEEVHYTKPLSLFHAYDLSADYRDNIYRAIQEL